MNKQPLTEQPAYAVQKAYNVRLVVCIIIYTLCGIPTIFGIISCIETPMLGLAVLVPTALVILATVLLHVTSIKKYRPLILSALSREILNAYDIDDSVTELFLTDGKKLSFTEDGTLLNGKAVNLEAAYATAALKIAPKIIHDEIFPVIVIKANKPESGTIIYGIAFSISKVSLSYASFLPFFGSGELLATSGARGISLG